MKKAIISLVISFIFVGIIKAQDGNKDLSYRMHGSEVITHNSVSFVKNSAEILPESMQALNTIKLFLNDKDYVSLLRVEGHVKCVNGDEALSKARAMAVCKWLISNGVDCKRLLPVGFGCTKPIIEGKFDENERITFIATMIRGKAYGGLPVDGGGKVAGDPCK